MKRTLFLLSACLLTFQGIAQWYGKTLSVQFGTRWDEAMDMVKRNHSLSPVSMEKNSWLLYGKCPFEEFEASSIKMIFQEGAFAVAEINFISSYPNQTERTYRAVEEYLLTKYGKPKERVTGKRPYSRWQLPWGATGEEVTQLMDIKTIPGEGVRVTRADRKLYEKYASERDKQLEGGPQYWDIPFGISRKGALKLAEQKKGSSGKIEELEHFIMCHNCPFENGKATLVRLHFENNELDVISVKQQSTEEDIVDVFKNTVARLKERFGNPMSTQEKYELPYKQGDGRRVEAIKKGAATITALWVVPQGDTKNKLTYFVSIRPDLSVEIDCHPHDQ